LTIAATREQERRRLRRDLHDGLGPALTGVSLGLHTALRQLEQAGDVPSAAAPRTMLARTTDEVDAAIVEVKRIVRDLRPTVLDELGLVDALAAFVGSLGDGLTYHLDLPDRHVEVPAATEVAVYRIVTEALTNVVRHAGATHCWLTISVGSSVDVAVLDDGDGVDDGAAWGVGWTAMRERAVEVGGTLEIDRRAPRGTRVLVRLPAASP
jgi:signal transduction histidine kinase